MIDLWTRQLSCGYHQCWLFYFRKITYLYFSMNFKLYSNESPLTWLFWLNTIVVTPIDIHLGYICQFLSKKAKIVINSCNNCTDVVGASPVGAAPTIFFHSQLNTWLQWIGQKELQDETTIIEVLWFGVTYITDFTACCISMNRLVVTWLSLTLRLS